MDRNTVAKWVYLTVTTTNAGAMDAKVPATESDWTAADRRAIKRLETFAKNVGASIQRTSYRLL